MQYLLDATVQELKEGAHVSVSISVVTVDAVSFTITDEDIVSDSFSIDRNSISGADIEVGNAETTEMRFSLDNFDGKFDGYKFEGAKASPVLTVNGESFAAGEFTIDNKPAKSDTFIITALDNMARMNKDYVSDLGATATLYDILSECCTKCGLVLHLPHNITGITYVAKVPHLEKTTYHQVTAWCAQLCGVNAFADYRGYICLAWYGENQVNESLTPSMLPAVLPFALGRTDAVIGLDSSVQYEFEAYENDVTITGVLYDNGIDTAVLVGTDVFAIEITMNPLLAYADTTAVLTTIFNKINGFTYRPFGLTTDGFPHLWAMDVITVTPKNGTPFQSIITNHSYTLNGNSTIKAQGASETQSGYASPQTLAKSQIASATEKANDAQEAADAAAAALVELAPLGLIEKAKLGETIIDKGLIKTVLLSASNIITGKMESADGKTYFDLDNSKILETAVIDGKTITVEMSAAKPFELSIDGYKQIYIKNGILITSPCDVNEDGYVDADDLDLVAYYVLHPAEIAAGLALYPKMDVNHDGNVSSSDLTLIARAAGMYNIMGVAPKQAGCDSGGFFTLFNGVKVYRFT